MQWVVHTALVTDVALVTFLAVGNADAVLISAAMNASAITVVFILPSPVPQWPGFPVA